MRTPSTINIIGLGDYGLSLLSPNGFGRFLKSSFFLTIALISYSLFSEEEFDESIKTKGDFNSTTDPSRKC